MLSILWNYLSGYVIIQIEGLGLERLMNHLAENGIELWDVRREGKLLTACISVAGFYRLPRYARKQRCRIHILGKRGLSVSLSRFRFRKILLLGWLAVLLALFLLSRCVWFIRVEGCDLVQEEEVLSLLEKSGIERGVRRRDVIPAALGSSIMAADTRIAWAGASLSGVVLRISVREADPIRMAQRGTEPASLYAARDGVITEIHAYSGRTMVKAGDAVRAGDILISGAVGNEEKPVYVAARGTVLATSPYVFETTVGPMLKKYVRSGASCEALLIRLKSSTLWGFTPPYPKAETQHLEEHRLRVLLPLEFTRCKCFELTLQETRASTVELTAAAAKRLHEAILLALPKDARLLSKQTAVETLPSGAVRMRVVLTAEQDIAETRRLVYDGGQELPFD